MRREIAPHAPCGAHTNAGFLVCQLTELGRRSVRTRQVVLHMWTSLLYGHNCFS